MHIIARILAVAYLALAAFSAVVYIQVVGNNVDVTYVVVHMEESVTVDAVVLYWDGNVSHRATISVNLSVRNPGRVAIEVQGYEYEFHMDDPNVPTSPFDPSKLQATWISTLSRSLGRGYGFVVGPGETRILATNVTVEPGTEAMRRLAKPDGNGLYHPLVWLPNIVYGFVNFETLGIRVYAPPYYAGQGVPLGG